MRGWGECEVKERRRERAMRVSSRRSEEEERERTDWVDCEMKV